MSEEEYREMEHDMLRDLIEILMRSIGVFILIAVLYMWVAK
jgi:hypothetical protein